MKIEIEMIAGSECRIFQQKDAEFLLVQPIDEEEARLLEQEVAMVSESVKRPFNWVAFLISDWNRELTPWPAPPAFGKVPFGDGAHETLSFITEHLLPELSNRGMGTSRCLLGGYSLAGLFALWAGYQQVEFEGIAAVSPSVWYPGWTDYVRGRKSAAKNVYLSLGDREERTKNPVMLQVGNVIRTQHELLKEQGINTILEWNPGNHFVDAEKRMAKGFAWLMNNI